MEGAPLKPIILYLMEFSVLVFVPKVPDATMYIVSPLGNVGLKGTSALLGWLIL